MTLNSIHYLAFFPLTVAIYYMIPKRFQWAVLLLASYYFYACWTIELVFWLALITITSYGAAFLIHKEETPQTKKRLLVVAVTGVLAVLFAFKYTNFALEQISAMVSFIGMPVQFAKVKWALPVGISFYTFMALGYLFDVYHQKIPVAKHLGKYALFISFFPHIAQGPIDRAASLLPQFDVVHKFDYELVKKGLLLILWGAFKKMVIADRLAMLVDTVFNGVSVYSGQAFWIASVFYTFQIYCDFSGYTDMALGSANVMGYQLTPNFNFPYLATSVVDFWRRWHISLTSWFRDYVYIPLGGNRVSELRWAINVMIVFLISGLWHGASWNFILWGGFHGLCQLIGKYKSKFTNIFLESNSEFFLKLVKVANVLITFLIVNFLWTLFRANSIEEWLEMFRKLFVPMKNFNVFKLGMQKEDFVFSIVLLVLLVILEYLHTKTDLYAFIQKQSLPVRWTVYMAGILTVILFGVYGTLSANSFIYFQF